MHSTIPQADMGAAPVSWCFELRPMLQALLADRFKLVVHNDAKPMPGFVLTMGKGKHKLKEADPAGKPGCQAQPFALRIVEGGGINAQSNVSCRNVTMDAFAAALRGVAAGYFTAAVIDATELKGAWDFDLKFTPKSLAPLAGSDSVSIFDAVDKQLGLKLEEKSQPRPVLVIDRVNRRPTDNPSDLAAKLPALPPAEFEVATIKPVDPNAPPRPIGLLGIQPGGRVNLPPLPLRSFISMAWSLSSNDEIVGAPKWIDSARFEIVAKAPAEYVPATGTGSILDIAPMLQSLIAERFKMKSHYEDRPVTAYTLVAPKPKLKKADPSARTTCRTATAGIISLGALPLPSSQVTCQNITMAEFANYLQVLAASYIRYPVLDATGLEGAWDFSFTYTAVNPAQIARNPFAPPAGQPASGALSASDPIGGISLFDAVEKQLGLKLEARKRAYPLFVIDHIEEKPADD